MNDFFVFLSEHNREKREIETYYPWLFEDSSCRFSTEEGHQNFNSKSVDKEIKDFCSMNHVSYQVIDRSFNFDTHRGFGVFFSNSKKNKIKSLVTHIRNAIAHNQITIDRQSKVITLLDWNRNNRNTFIRLKIKDFCRILRIIDSHS